MNWFEALILGLVQGLTEFLPVSSSGHLELGKAILGVDPERSLVFTVVVHGATVLSTIVVFRKDLWKLIREVFAIRWKDAVALRFTETMQYNFKLILSMIPVVILGLFFMEEIESLFTGRVVFVGFMLIVTALLLASTYLIKNNNRKITFADSLIIGIAQAIAVIPGISRSGATISTGLLLGNKRELVTKFSFLMVLIPIIGANAKDLAGSEMMTETTVSATSLLIGFAAAFISGFFACKWMIGIVKKGNLVYFSAYCFIIGLIAIIFG
ncbi:MAG: undecaprenyl-diphosphate phosphatase [Bacteroidales bacterium]|nr:undecaprenyl-diphosphate phosphatase [Bacteroidales bacterium]